MGPAVPSDVFECAVFGEGVATYRQGPGVVSLTARERGYRIATLDVPDMGGDAEVWVAGERMPATVTAQAGRCGVRLANGAVNLAPGESLEVRRLAVR